MKKRKEILMRIDAGETARAVAASLGMAESAISQMKKRRQSIMDAPDDAKSTVSRIRASAVHLVDGGSQS